MKYRYINYQNFTLYPFTIASTHFAYARRDDQAELAKQYSSNSNKAD